MRIRPEKAVRQDCLGCSSSNTSLQAQTTLYTCKNVVIMALAMCQILLRIITPGKAVRQYCLRCSSGSSSLQASTVLYKCKNVVSIALAICQMLLRI